MSSILISGTRTTILAIPREMAEQPEIPDEPVTRILYEDAATRREFQGESNRPYRERKRERER